MIAAALRAMADDVEERATTTMRDTHLRPTEEQRSAKADKVRTVARALRALADAAETQTVRFGEYQALTDRLYAFGFPLTPRLEQDIAAAFRDAAGPMAVREKGWLKQS